MNRGILIAVSLLLIPVGSYAARLAESFDCGFPPEGWVVYDLDSGYCGWNRDTTIVRSAPGSARCWPENSGIRNNSWLITPRLLVSADDRLSFAYRPHGIPNEPYRESLEVRVSVGGIGPGAFTDRIWAKGFHQTAWESAGISLAAYAGESIHIAFRQCGINSFSTWLDDVRGPEVWQPDTDVALRAIRYPERFAMPGDTVRLQFVLKNCGAEPVGVVPVSYAVRDSLSGSIVQQGMEYAPPLQPGDTVRLTATDFWLADAGSYTVTVQCRLAGDKNRNNDSLRANLRVSWTQEEAFDDGRPAFTINWSAQGFGCGVRFKPRSYPARLVSVACGLNPDWEPAPGGDSVNIWILRARQDGTPGAVIAEMNNVAVRRGAWNRIELNTRIIRVDSGSIFVFILQPRPRLIGWNLDMKDDAPESTQWVRYYGVYYPKRMVSQMPPGEFLIRAELKAIRNDVGTGGIIAPSDTVAEGISIVPAAVVRNFSEDWLSPVPVVFRIGTVYESRVGIESIAPGAVDTVRFADWTTQRGDYVVSCSTELTGDIRPDNDRATGRLFVLYRDIAVRRIISPAGPIIRGETIVPQVVLANPGSSDEQFTARAVITRNSVVYADSLQCYLAAGETLAAEFAAWCAESTGEYSITASVKATGDMNPANDSLIGQFRVDDYDVCVTAILSPQGGIDTGNVVTPVVVVRNQGNQPSSFPVTVMITDPQGQVTLLPPVRSESLLPGDYDTLTFAGYTVHHPGNYTLRCSTGLSRDANPANDTLTGYFSGQLPAKWHQLADLPPGPRARNVKAGGALAATPDIIYALKGNRTNEFYAYYPAGDSWHTCAPVPGRGGIQSGAGCCWSRTGRLYVVKGGNRSEFRAYAPEEDCWYEPAAVPGPEGVKAGSGIVGSESGRIYLLKGGSSREFWCYQPEANRWQRCADAPPGRSWRPGSCIAAARDYLYLLRGFDNQLFAYSTDDDTWYLRNPLPFTGRSKRARSGTALTGQGDNLWLVKGGRSGELWHYCTFGDTWTQYPTLPAGTQGRRVAAGGAITACGNRLYALKGNNTREFWCYTLSPVTPAAHRATAALKADYQPPGNDEYQLLLYDASGRRRAVLTPGQAGSVRPGAKGVYFLQLRTSRKVMYRKIIVQ